MAHHRFWAVQYYLATMPRRTLHFAGPLANTGGSLRSVKLSAPFRIERWNYDKLADLIGDMQGKTDWHPDHRVDELHCIPEYGTTGHVVTASIDVEMDEADTDAYMKIHRQLHALDERLDEQLLLLSLFFSSTTTLPARYWYFVLPGSEREMISASEGRADNGHRAAPSYREALKFNSFLAKHSFERRAEFIQIALDHWRHSQDTVPRHMQLLSLITAIEVLLNPAQTELKHRVTRAAAILIGSDAEDCRQIYSFLGKIYDVRSQIVHTGNLKGLSKFPLLQIRWYLSRAIIRAMELGLPKDRLCASLVELGFGQGHELKPARPQDGL